MIAMLNYHIVYKADILWCMKIPLNSIRICAMISEEAIKISYKKIVHIISLIIN